jgi:hypothetical protein
MADKKISQLTAATTPLAGTEVLPIVQSGSTVKATVADVTNRLNLGTMATQNANSVAVTGGSINGTTVGATTPSSGKFFSATTDAVRGSQSNPGLPGFSNYPLSETFTSGFALAGGASKDISTFTVESNWTVVFIGSYSNNYEGGGLVRPAAYYEVNQTNNTIPVGSTSIQVSVNGTTGKLQVTNLSGSFGVIFTGLIIITLNGTGADPVNSMVLQKNLVIGTADKGIDFSANTHAAGMTSELLNDYEEGTWTPNQGGGIVVVGAFTSSGTYTKIGRQVTVTGSSRGATSIAVGAGSNICTNLPFTVGSLGGSGTCVNDGLNASSVIFTYSTIITSTGAIGASPTLNFTATYFV